MKLNYHLALQLLLGLVAVACQSQSQEQERKQTDYHRASGRDKVPAEMLDCLPYKVDTVLQTARFLFLAHGQTDPLALGAFVQHTEATADRLVNFTGSGGATALVIHHLYASSEEKGLITGNTTHSQAEFATNEVHTVLDEVYHDNFTGKENELLLRQMLGAPALPALERGLAIFFTDRWQKKGWQHWATRLATSGNLPPLTALSDEVARQPNTDLPAECLAAAFAAFLIDKWGRKDFLKKYNDWLPTPAETADLEPELLTYLTSFAQADTISPLQPPGPLTPRTLTGFNLAHEGYAIYNGYGSRMATAALDKLRSLGSNAVAIVPYSFLRQPDVPAPIPVMNRPGSENDESIIHTAFQAKKKGMSVLIKPQLWLGRQYWTGDIAMHTEEDWQSFFRYYHRWMTHYALLAEIYQWDMLCIGTELVQTTLQRPTEWRELIRRIRGLYKGSITYAANWGEEFENLIFWNDLDFIGLNCYYPLCQKGNATDRELRKGFSKVVQKIGRVGAAFQKPVVFTEIGFPSRESPWITPHSDRHDAPFNAEHQRRCYEVVFGELENKPWFRGIFWWKFPTFQRRQADADTGFSPSGKPAEAVVGKWFAKINSTRW